MCFTEVLCHALDNILACDSYVILCGDFNIHFHKPGCNKFKILSDILESYNLSVATSSPTRIFTDKNGKTYISTIDYVITNMPRTLFSCNVVNLYLGDHLGHVMTFNENIFKFNTINNSDSCITIRDTRHSRLNEFKFLLQKINWNFIYNHTDVNKVYTEFMSNIRWCFEASCPLVKIKTKNRFNNSTSWITTDLIDTAKELENLHWLIRASGIDKNDKINTLFKNKRSEYKTKMSKAKLDFYDQKIKAASNKPKEIWKIVNDRLNKSTEYKNKITEIYHEDQLLRNETIIANTFAEHFSSNCQNLVYKDYGSLKTDNFANSNSTVNSIFIPYVTDLDVRNLILAQKPKNSAGIDRISPRILKEICEYIETPFTYIINLSLQSGVFPDMMKAAIIIPIYKKGDPLNIENYRQISLLSSFSKILERTAYNILNDFIEKNKILSTSQHGFRKNKSTETASISLLNYVYNELDKGKMVVSLLLDLKSAFDCINPRIICDKLYNLGIREPMLNWIYSYLCNRSLIVQIDNYLSQSHDITLGVPQGSVLGPLIFLLYVNDLPSNITQGYVTMFADDTTISISGNTQEEIQNATATTMKQFKDWCSRNRLLLNEEKTELIRFHFHPVNNICPLTLQNLKLNNKDTVKLLGTYFDANLKFSSQIDYVCNKLNKAYYALLQLKNVLNEEGLTNTYYALAHSHMSYNILSWGTASNWERAFICQKRLVRLMFDLKFGESCRQTLKKKRILTLPSIYILKCVTYVKANPNSFLRTNSSRNNNLTIPVHRHSTYKKSPNYNCITLYNSLPTELKSIQVYKQFKTQVKKFLINNCFYSISEFREMN